MHGHRPTTIEQCALHRTAVGIHSCVQLGVFFTIYWSTSK